MVDTNKIITGLDIDYGKASPAHWDLAVDEIKPWHKSGGLF